jgi:hypothetical protein
MFLGSTGFEPVFLHWKCNVLTRLDEEPYKIFYILIIK